MVRPAQGPIVTDEEAKALMRTAGEVVNKNKHWRLSQDDFEDARAELVTEALTLKLAYQDGGMDEVLEVALRRAYGRWEYQQRKVFKNETLSALTDAGEVDSHDVYFQGSEDQHAS